MLAADRIRLRSYLLLASGNTTFMLSGRPFTTLDRGKTMNTVCLCILHFVLAVHPGDSYGVSQSSSSWSTKPADGEKSIAGIHSASVTSMRMMAGSGPGLQLILWCNKGSLSGSSGSSPKEGGYYRGSQVLPNGEKLLINASTPDGQKGSVKIGKQKFDIANGSLFLISSTRSKPFVKQLAVKEKEFPEKLELEKLIQYAKTNPEIMAFWVTETKN